MNSSLFCFPIKKVVAIINIIAFIFRTQEIFPRLNIITWVSIMTTRRLAAYITLIEIKADKGLDHYIGGVYIYAVFTRYMRRRIQNG